MQNMVKFPAVRLWLTTSFSESIIYGAGGSKV